MSDLPAGRALDVEIATKVFGLTVVALDWPCGYLPPCYELVASETAEPEIDLMTERRPVYRDAHAEVRPVPFYSTDISAAWDVWEWLLAHEVPSIGQLQYYDRQYSVLTAWGNAWRVVPGSIAPTASEAICRAALAALGQRE